MGQASMKNCLDWLVGRVTTSSLVCVLPVLVLGALVLWYFLRKPKVGQ
jgi:hypothetical protein